MSTPYTRVTEFKYLTGQEHPKTSDRLRVSQGPKAIRIIRFRARRMRLCTSNTRLWPDATPDVHFVGRLATYKYYNMDQVVAQALTLFSKISSETQVPVGEFSGKKMLYPGYSNGKPKVAVQVKEGNQNGKRVA